MIRAVILVAAGLAAFALRPPRETRRKQRETALRASEGGSRTRFEYAPDGILIADPESNYIDANPSMCRMLGHTRAELTRMRASDIVDEAETQHIGPAPNTIRAKSGSHREWQFRRKDGSVFAADMIATMMPDGNLLAMIRDVTERKVAQSALRESNRRFHETLENIELIAMTLDKNGTVTFCNEFLLRLTGGKREEVIGHSWLDTFLPHSAATAKARFRSS